MKRTTYLWLITATLCASWLGMMFVHEAGHVLHAWVSGGRVERVVLHPLRFSRTDVSPNPHPRFVAWGGARWGIIIPLMVWGIALLARVKWAYLLRFFAGFCLVANGAYIGVGGFMDASDAGDMRSLGTPLGELILYGVVCVTVGLLLWDRQSKHFREGTRPQAIAVTILLVLLIAVGMMTA